MTSRTLTGSEVDAIILETISARGCIPKTELMAILYPDGYDSSDISFLTRHITALRKYKLADRFQKGYYAYVCTYGMTEHYKSLTE